jgi:hypothetical protein
MERTHGVQSRVRQNHEGAERAERSETPGAAASLAAGRGGNAGKNAAREPVRIFAVPAKRRSPSLIGESLAEIAEIAESAKSRT